MVVDGDFDELNFVHLGGIGEELAVGDLRDDDFGLHHFLLEDPLIDVLNIHLLHFILRLQPRCFTNRSVPHSIRRESKVVIVEDALEACVAETRRPAVFVLAVDAKQVAQAANFRVGDDPLFASRVPHGELLEVTDDALDDIAAELVGGRVLAALVVAVEEVGVNVFVLEGFDQRAVGDRQGFEKERLAHPLAQQEEAFGVGARFGLFCWFP